MRDLPTGTVTFLFPDIEGSTRMLQELGRGPVHLPEIGLEFLGDPADQAREALGDEAFERGRAEGEAMTLAQMIELLEDDTG